MSKWILFGLAILAQWFVPIQMIWESEQVLTNGKTFKFSTAPVDPVDPFRGRFVALAFEQEIVPIQPGYTFSFGQTVYIELELDPNGFAKAIEAHPFPPTSADYVSAEIRQLDSLEVQVSYPFEKYFMEESQAILAERAYADAGRNDPQDSYAVVLVHDGQAILKALVVDGQSVDRLESP